LWLLLWRRWRCSGDAAGSLCCPLSLHAAPPPPARVPPVLVLEVKRPQEYQDVLGSNKIMAKRWGRGEGRPRGRGGGRERELLLLHASSTLGEHSALTHNQGI
jgi:hypothetical protein